MSPGCGKFLSLLKVKEEIDFLKSLLLLSFGQQQQQQYSGSFEGVQTNLTKGVKGALRLSFRSTLSVNNLPQQRGASCWLTQVATSVVSDSMC